MKFINLHTHSSNNTSHLEVLNVYPNEAVTDEILYSTGIHPWYIDKKNIANELQIIENRLQQKNCLALGECGLDKRIEIAIETQTTVFLNQLELAKTTNKPIILHCVGAFEEIIKIKKEFKVKNQMIVHGFSKNYEVAQQLIQNGFNISFGKYLFQNEKTVDAFRRIALENIFLETDTIAKNLEEVYTFAAEIREISIETLKATVYQNFINTFHYHG